MKRNLLVLSMFVSAFVLNVTPALAWGKREHAAIARIAEQNLSAKARKGIAEILGDQKPSSYASWLDYYKTQMMMKLTEPQSGKMVRTIPHTFQVDSALNAYRNPERSCITVVEESVAKLKNRASLDDSTRFQCLLNIIHLVGDMHCPGHVIYADKRDRHIGKFDVYFRGEKTNFHRVWDSMVTGDTFAGGVEDLAYFAMTADKKQIREWQSGSLYDWGSDVAHTSSYIWDVKVGDDLGTRYMYDLSRLALTLICRAGYRLAKVLNETFK